MEERFQTFTVLVTDINRSIHKLKTKEMEEFDLKSSHVSCLYYLFKTGSMTATELCDICREDKANISRAIKSLEDNGYVVCNSKKQKRYQSQLTLTDMGAQVASRIAKKIDKVLDAVSEGVSDEHRAIMYHALAKISANLQKLCEDTDL